MRLLPVGVMLGVGSLALGGYDCMTKIHLMLLGVLDVFFGKGFMIADLVPQILDVLLLLVIKVWSSVRLVLNGRAVLLFRLNNVAGSDGLFFISLSFLLEHHRSICIGVLPVNILWMSVENKRKIFVESRKGET